MEKKSAKKPKEKYIVLVRGKEFTPPPDFKIEIEKTWSSSGSQITK